MDGERRVQSFAPDSIIVRSAFYGWSLHNVTGLADWVVSELRDGNTIKMFMDEFFSPILVNNLAEALIEMHHENLSGLYHVGGSERCSKYAFGMEIAEAFGLDKGLIQSSSILDAGSKVRRPKDTSLDIRKVSQLINTRLLNVREGVAKLRDLELYLG